jgi:hypothetical protein
MINNKLEINDRVKITKGKYKNKTGTIWSILSDNFYGVNLDSNFGGLSEVEIKFDSLKFIPIQQKDITFDDKLIMRGNDFEEFVNEFNGEANKILFTKGHDYADKNVLANFMRMAVYMSILERRIWTPEGCSLFLKMLKVERDANLYHGNKTPKFESTKDTDLDERNYHLLRCAIKENCQKFNKDLEAFLRKYEMIE